MLTDPATLLATADAHPIPAITGSVAALIVLFLLTRLLTKAVRAAAAALVATVRALARHDQADLATYAAAGLATSISAQGMWLVAGDSLHFPIALRIVGFAVLEVALLAAAIRARRNVRDSGSAGREGVAVWVISSFSALLSAMHANNAIEIAFRLGVPALATWLWERLLGADRQASGNATAVTWALSPRRILVRFGLIDAGERSTEQAEIERRITTLARAAYRARIARAATGRFAGRRWRLAAWRLQRATRRAVAITNLATDPDLSRSLLAQIGALSGALALVDVTPAAPWASTAAAEEPAPVTGEALPGAPEQLALALPPSGVLALHRQHPRTASPGAVRHALGARRRPLARVAGSGAADTIARVGSTVLQLCAPGVSAPDREHQLGSLAEMLATVDPPAAEIARLAAGVLHDLPDPRATGTATFTDDQILDHLRSSPTLPSIRGLQKSHQLRFNRAQKFIDQIKNERTSTTAESESSETEDHSEEPAKSA